VLADCGTCIPRLYSCCANVQVCSASTGDGIWEQALIGTSGGTHEAVEEDEHQGSNGCPPSASSQVRAVGGENNGVVGEATMLRTTRIMKDPMILRPVQNWKTFKWPISGPLSCCRVRWALWTTVAVDEYASSPGLGASRPLPDYRHHGGQRSAARGPQLLVGFQLLQRHVATLSEALQLSSVDLLDVPRPCRGRQAWLRT